MVDTLEEVGILGGAESPIYQIGARVVRIGAWSCGCGKAEEADEGRDECKGDLHCGDFVRLARTKVGRQGLWLEMAACFGGRGEMLVREESRRPAGRLHESMGLYNTLIVEGCNGRINSTSSSCLEIILLVSCAYMHFPCQ